MNKITKSAARMLSVKKQDQYARVRKPGEVLPPAIDKMHGPLYVPPKAPSVRPGSMDFKDIPSLGTEHGSAIYHRGHK